MPRAVVTGGAGFLGSHICDLLRARDWEVVAVLHLASAASPPEYLAHPIETLEVGALGTRRALDLAREHGARFLVASTSEIYGDPLVHPQPETYFGNVNSVGPR